MRWRFPIFVSSVLFAFVFGLFITTGNTYAIQDLVVTSTSASDFSTFCDSSACSSYKYLIVEADSSVPNNAYFSLAARRFPSGKIYDFQIPLRSKYLIFKLDNLQISDPSFRDFQFYSYNNFSSGTITLTFTETELSFGQNCPVCPEIPENPYDDKLDSIIQAIYVVAGTLLVLYFFYCIYRLIIRNSGVK